MKKRNLSSDKILYTRATVKGKVCSNISDGGNCENIVATKTVNKIKLPTKKYDQLHSLMWLNKRNKINIDKRCLIEISIGARYWDQVWCDVIPIEVCHLLLDWPWQYNKKHFIIGIITTRLSLRTGRILCCNLGEEMRIEPQLIVLPCYKTGRY